MVGYIVKELTLSPVKGPEGNIEYLLFLEKKEELSEEVLDRTETEAEKMLQEILSETEGKHLPESVDMLIADTVAQAHQVLD